MPQRVIPPPVCAAGGVRPTSVLRAEALQKRKCSRRARRASDQRSGPARSASGVRAGGSGLFGPGGWNARDARQPESRVHLVAGGRLQAAAAQLLPPRYARQRPCRKDRHCSTVKRTAAAGSSPKALVPSPSLPLHALFIFAPAHALLCSCRLYKLISCLLRNLSSL
jgi:hypothetical protein